MTAASGLIYITADDGAINPGIDASIEELALSGVLTAVCAFSTAPNLLGRLAEQLPVQVDLGLHLNLSSGSPATSPAQIPSLVTSDGLFHSATPEQRDAMGDSISVFLADVVPGFEPAEVRVELRAQVEAFRDCVGRPPSFSSFHHDLDMHPLIRSIASDELPALPGRQARLATGDLAHVVSRFLSPSDSRAQATAEITELLNGALQSSVLASGSPVEMVCHPGYVDTTLPEFTVYTAERQLEHLAWSSAEVRRLLASGQRTRDGWLFVRDNMETPCD
jgi:predicted glycoside hydrolase/deacetylase ChbG (UPF0249 family)